MAFGHPTMTAMLIINAVLGILFVWQLVEGFKLADADVTAHLAVESPWVDRFRNGLGAVLCFGLLAVDVMIVYRLVLT